MIEVEPLHLDFGSVSDEDDPAVLSFIVRSVGAMELEIDGIEVSGQASGSFTVVSDEASFVLPPNTEREIDVVFEPMSANGQSAQALISSNDEFEPTVAVSLYGEGLIAELQITPDPLDYGTVYVGCTKENQVTLKNIGSKSLDVTDIGIDEGEFLITEAPDLPFTLDPEEEAFVYTEFLPSLEGNVTQQIHVTSTEPMGVRDADQLGEGEYAASYEDIWDNPAQPPTDIVFSVDQSSSMDDNQAQLANNFSTFITQLSNYTTDWQIIVVNDDDGCTDSGIITSTTNPTVFQNAVSSGKSWFDNAFTESLLTVTSRAVDNTDMGECNAGFMRSEAMLHIIMVSDEPEQSPSSWSSYVNAIVAKKGNAANVRMSAIAGDVPSGCSSAEPGTGYAEAVDSTGGVFLSICSDWANANNLELLAEASVQQDSFALSHEAVEETIEVMINDQEVDDDDWYYDETQNVVIFVDSSPEEGDELSITYAAPATCD